ncbi:histidine kinase [Tolypothrix sp. FACHB-123]|uniref:histidine kinase n=1 Tax=Tolypothrix sp. FACHB-123 TaxID=2692868 RepID=UPI001687E7A6|nr:histidine kinase [Tolypothrix sp. FACHB-123]MBD2356246.1 histidine kinase [Tolypothrix sp. FACHB-123]
MRWFYQQLAALPSMGSATEGEQTNAPCPMPNAQCPMPNAPCPMPKINLPKP